MWGKCLNAGQTCIAPDHVFVHENVKEKFVALCSATLEKAYGTSGEPGPHYTRIVNGRHTARLKALLDDAKAKGATVLTGGTFDEKEHFIAPTLLENVPTDAKVMQEEIFGPLLPVMTFTSLDDVIGKINAEPKPLALYLYSRDDRAVEKVLSETTSGGAVINHSLVQYAHARLPFGGVNNSGIGNSHGVFGFKAFSHERAVVKSPLKVAKLFAPGEVPQALRKMLKKVWKLV
jgi:aldehyde dehydrogenase (NAD+)